MALNAPVANVGALRDFNAAHVVAAVAWHVRGAAGGERSGAGYVTVEGITHKEVGAPPGSVIARLVRAPVE